MIYQQKRNTQCWPLSVIRCMIIYMTDRQTSDLIVVPGSSTSTSKSNVEYHMTTSFFMSSFFAFMVEDRKYSSGMSPPQLILREKEEQRKSRGRGSRGKFTCSATLQQLKSQPCGQSSWALYQHWYYCNILAIVSVWMHNYISFLWPYKGSTSLTKPVKQ